jgi:hypothetical protein
MMGIMAGGMITGGISSMRRIKKIMDARHNDYLPLSQSFFPLQPISFPPTSHSIRKCRAAAL